MAYYFIILIIVAWIAAFSLLVSFVFLLSSLIGGWRSYASKFHFSGSFDGKVSYFQSAVFNYFVNYNHILDIAANEKGILFRLNFSFMPFHKPFFVPWNELAITHSKFLWVKIVTLKPVHTSAPPIVLKEQAFLDIAPEKIINQLS